MTENFLSIVRRDDVPLTIQIYDDEDETILTPIDGFTFWFTAKTNPTDADPGVIQVKKVVSSPSPINETTLILTSADTDITAGKYYYDIQQKDLSGEITTFLIGTLVVEQDITVDQS